MKVSSLLLLGKSCYDMHTLSFAPMPLLGEDGTGFVY